MPGRSLWYARLAYERMIADEILMWTDPGASQGFRRIERRAKKDFDQRFWWRPGRTLPERVPELLAAVGFP